MSVKVGTIAIITNIIDIAVNASDDDLARMSIWKPWLCIKSNVYHKLTACLKENIRGG